MVELCDFENEDLCSWQNSNDVELEWLLNVGPTPSEDTGPSYDHTYEHETIIQGLTCQLFSYYYFCGFTFIYYFTLIKLGHYVFIDARDPAKPGWRAHLVSEPMISKFNGCISFWYHMFGFVSLV